jgi:hypothetical protein
MKFTKRIVSVVLCAVLLLSAALMMVSCDEEATKIETIKRTAKRILVRGSSLWITENAGKN